METARLAAFEPCMALPHMQEFDAVKKNNAAGGFITDEQADTVFIVEQSATDCACIWHGRRQEDD